MWSSCMSTLKIRRMSIWSLSCVLVASSSTVLLLKNSLPNLWLRAPSDKFWWRLTIVIPKTSFIATWSLRTSYFRQPMPIAIWKLLILAFPKSWLLASYNGWKLVLEPLTTFLPKFWWEITMSAATCGLPDACSTFSFVVTLRSTETTTKRFLRWSRREHLTSTAKNGMKLVQMPRTLSRSLSASPNVVLPLRKHLTTSGLRIWPRKRPMTSFSASSTSETWRVSKKVKRLSKSLLWPLLFRVIPTISKNLKKFSRSLTKMETDLSVSTSFKLDLESARTVPNSSKSCAQLTPITAAQSTTLVSLV